MDAERWQQVDRVLQGALDLEGAEREAYLDEACAGDAELRAEVEELLGVDLTEDRFLASPAIASAGVEIDDPFGPGKAVGPYRIEALVGEGGMGAVYRARDERLGRAVAIKVMTGGANAGLLRRFTQETRLASALNHPNILTVYDVGALGGAPYLVTEYVEGESLRARMAAGLASEDAVEIARQVASALGAAHGAGIVHRDIKPENVIVRGDGLVKVLDFGIAKLVEGARPVVGSRGDELEVETALQTAPGVMVGTPSYMSPEQARGEAVDGRTDVWSLGVMLYEMVVGHRPFRGPTRMDVLAAVLGAQPEPAAGMAPGLAEVVGRALGKRAWERYATIGEMAAALEGLGGRLGGRESGGTTANHEAETREQPAAPTNLPEERERLIGRERELRAVVDELRRTRLLTVTGPGGTGKTRLATDAGRAMLHEFEGGVFFVELAAIRDPGLVASAVAQVLGVKEGGGSLEDAIAERLRGRDALLVLDNFEQVVAAAPFVARLLAAASRVKALVTSRERLHLSAERELALSPLALPPADGVATGEELASYGSVALFVERARAVRPGFELETQTEANLAAVAEICRRLEGLPLAIELAATRLRMLTPEALFARLDSQLKLLVGGARDLPARQQTMRAAIAWSYDLLDEDERRLFERLSVFSGGWTLEAAEALDPDEEVLDPLTQLADKSLVAATDDGEGFRYHMLETIRQFAAEKLRETGEEPRARGAHAAWFLTFVEAAVRGSDRATTKRRLDRDVENVRAALEWSEREGDASETMLRLSASMELFWESRGMWTEGRSWMERALAANRTPSSARAAVLLRLSALARLQSDFERAHESAAESLAMCRELGDRRGAGSALAALATVSQRRGEMDTAEALLREGLALAEDLGDDRLRALMLSRLGDVAYERNDLDTFVAILEEALVIHRALGDRQRVGVELYNLAIVAERRGEYDRATELLDESLALARELGERPLMSRVIHFLGNVARGQGDYARAGELRAEAAREYRAMGDVHMLAFMIEDVINELLGRGLTERAARLLGALGALEKAGELPPAAPGDTSGAELLAAARTALGETDAEAAMAKGRRLSLDEALELAFSD